MSDRDPDADPRQVLPDDRCGGIEEAGARRVEDGVPHTGARQATSGPQTRSRDRVGGSSWEPSDARRDDLIGRRLGSHGCERRTIERVRDGAAQAGVVEQRPVGVEDELVEEGHLLEEVALLAVVRRVAARSVQAVER